jgi:hypothetical protein
LAKFETTATLLKEVVDQLAGWKWNLHVAEDEFSQKMKPESYDLSQLQKQKSGILKVYTHDVSSEVQRAKLYGKRAGFLIELFDGLNGKDDVIARSIGCYGMDLPVVSDWSQLAQEKQALGCPIVLADALGFLRCGIGMSMKYEKAFLNRVIHISGTDEACQKLLSNFTATETGARKNDTPRPALKIVITPPSP